MSADGQSYLDSSALVKLVLVEAESTALRAHLAVHPRRASSALAQVEVVRAVRPEGEGAVERARELLADVSLVALGGSLLSAAADLDEPELRSLDAIHVAAAVSLGDDLAELITYDRRMAEAARGFGLPVIAPA